MSFKTNNELVSKQVAFWDADFYIEGDEVSTEVENMSLEDITLPDPDVLEIYANDPKDLEIIEAMKTAMSSGIPFPPILLDKNNNVLDGYHRVLASKALNYKQVPCIRLNR